MRPTKEGQVSCRRQKKNKESPEGGNTWKYYSNTKYDTKYFFKIMKPWILLLRYCPPALCAKITSYFFFENSFFNYDVGTTAADVETCPINSRKISAGRVFPFWDIAFHLTFPIGKFSLRRLFFFFEAFVKKRRPLCRSCVTSTCFKLDSQIVLFSNSIPL